MFIEAGGRQPAAGRPTRTSRERIRMLVSRYRDLPAYCLLPAACCLLH
jgi:hypothetical protein